MPLPTDIGATFRARTPSVYERGRAQTVSLEARLGASLVAPTSGTFTLRSPTGATVSTSAVTVSGSVAFATVAADDLPSTLSFGDGYLEEWDLTIDGKVITGRREAYIARRMLHCPVTQADLEAVQPRIGTLVGPAVADLQGYIDEAWAHTLARLVSAGRWPEAVAEPTSLRPYVQARSLYHVFRSMMTAAQGAGADRYTALTEHWGKAADGEWGNIRYRVDTDQDGVVDSLDRQGAAQVMRRGVSSWYGHRTRRVVL